MEQSNPGSKKLPDFKELSDRFIAPAPSQPTLVIKTNLDPKNVTEENPYFNQKVKNENEFQEYFKE